MIYRNLLLAILVSLSLFANAQTSKKFRYSERTCRRISDSTSVAFSRLMGAHQYDSAERTLNFWKAMCGRNEEVFTAQLIISFATGGNVDSLIDKESIYYLNLWQNSNRFQNARNSENDSFYTFTLSFFRKEKNGLLPGTTKYLISEVYSNSADTLFNIIQTDEYKGTGLASVYYELVNKLKNKPEFNIAAIAGAWIPTGGITRLGTHPDVGYQIGAKYKKANIDLTAVFKFNRAKNPYQATRVRSDKSVVVTNKFFGGYIGIDGGYDVWRKKNNEFQVLAGGGIDGFDAIDQDTIRNLKAETTWTYNFNFGGGYRLYIDNWVYIGVRAKYNIVNYALRGVVDFTGNPITIHIVVGGLHNKKKKEALEELKYKWSR